MLSFRKSPIKLLTEPEQNNSPLRNNGSNYFESDSRMDQITLDLFKTQFKPFIRERGPLGKLVGQKTHTQKSLNSRTDKIEPMTIKRLNTLPKIASLSLGFDANQSIFERFTLSNSSSKPKLMMKRSKRVLKPEYPSIGYYNVDYQHSSPRSTECIITKCDRFPKDREPYLTLQEANTPKKSVCSNTIEQKPSQININKILFQELVAQKQKQQFSRCLVDLDLKQLNSIPFQLVSMKRQIKKRKFELELGNY